eukprot:15253-Heterococcus_DN1.PRE.1
MSYTTYIQWHDTRHNIRFEVSTGLAATNDARCITWQFGRFTVSTASTEATTTIVRSAELQIVATKRCVRLQHYSGSYPLTLTYINYQQCHFYYTAAAAAAATQSKTTNLAHRLHEGCCHCASACWQRWPASTVVEYVSL